MEHCQYPMNPSGAHGSFLLFSHLTSYHIHVLESIKFMFSCDNLLEYINVRQFMKQSLIVGNLGGSHILS